jgi:hypothetical protein
VSADDTGNVVSLIDRLQPTNITCECGSEWWSVTAVLTPNPDIKNLDGSYGIRLAGFVIPIICTQCGTRLTQGMPRV